MAKQKRAMPFRPGDYVAYPAHGLGKIVSIETDVVAGFTLELYVIAFEQEGLTLRVPTHKAMSTGMRQLASTTTVAKALTVLQGAPKIKRAMWSRKATEYKQKLHSGDLIAVAEVVRDLHGTEETRREQSYSEREIYESALVRLTREVAAVLDMSELDAIKHVSRHTGKGLAHPNNNRLQPKKRRLAADMPNTAGKKERRLTASPEAEEKAKEINRSLNKTAERELQQLKRRAHTKRYVL